MKDNDETDSNQNDNELAADAKVEKNESTLDKKQVENKEPKSTASSVVKTEPSKSKENLFNAKPVPKMNSAKSKKNIFIPIITFIFFLLLFAISAWNYYQQQLTTDSLRTLNENLKVEIKQQSELVKSSAQQNSQINNEMQEIKQGFQALANYNNDLKLQLNSAQEKIKSLSGRRKQDWMLAEVEYLVDIAALKLSLQKDKNTALQLLKTADEKLIEIADQSLFPIREAIARDISSISLIQESDITGIIVTLNAIDQQIEQLDLLALKFSETDVIENPVDTSTRLNEQNSNESSTDLSEIYKRFVNEFIVIKEHTEIPQPLMTPNQRGNLNQNISLALQQAQLAALQGNEQLYLLNLNKTSNWITEYFGEGEQPSSIIKQIDDLKLEKIDVRYPSKLESLVEIEASKKNQLYDWLDNSLNPSIEDNKSNLTKPEQDNDQGVSNQ
ncbi:MAG: uroporphyrinogen-III C-methyltransferase [Kangiellaceae bacterium]